MTQYPEPTIGAFVFNENGEVLLAKSPKWDDGKVWIVAGGHIDMGETIKETVQREVFEELGVRVEFKRVFNVLESIYDEKFSSKKHFIFLQCECMILPDQVIKIDNDEITEAKWFSLKDALDQNLLEQTRKSIEKLIQENK